VKLDEYLTSKKIDSAAFQKAEPKLWNDWNIEFEQMHPNSFTVQKLNLINPIRRKYPLKSAPEKVIEQTGTQAHTPSPGLEPGVKPITPAATPKPAVPRPVFKPKPKMQ
jgi:hypothetical protein